MDTNNSPGPLGWLEGWQDRLDAMQGRADWEPGRLDHMVYRPCPFGRDALVLLLNDHPDKIRFLQKSLQDVENEYEELLSLLLPAGCPECASFDFDDVPIARGWIVRRCNQCEADSKLAKPADRKIGLVQDRCAEAVGTLAWDIRSVLKAIGRDADADNGGEADIHDGDLEADELRILRDLHEQEAFTSATRQTYGKIAYRILGEYATSEDVKRRGSRLVRLGLLASKRGRGGGIWLTKAGEEKVKR